MLILGISEGHESHACLIKSGKLLAAVAEERFSRIKTDCGYPKTAIEKVFEKCRQRLFCDWMWGHIKFCQQI